MSRFKSNFVIWHDDTNMASPEEDAKYSLSEEQERQLTERLEAIFREFCLGEAIPEAPTDSFNVAKYILEQQGAMSTWQLQKLCYYAQAWHYTWTNKRLIKQNFQAWKDGPVCRELYNLHRGKVKVTADDIPGSSDSLTTDQKDSIDVMLEHYGNLSGDELRTLTHSEEPWIRARGNLSANAHSEKIISLESMGEYYHNHLI